MRVPARLVMLCLAGLAGGLLACYTGEGFLGAVCETDDQCGIGQDCTNSICGLCRDGQIQPGELCYGSSSEENVFGAVSDLLAFDPEGDGNPVLVATVNTNCQDPPNAGPPAPMGGSCWEAYLFLTDPDGDFEAVKAIVDPMNPNEKRDGQIPQAATGDFDGEGTNDVALALIPSDEMLSAQLLVAHNFVLENRDPDPFPISLEPATLLAADMNGDGRDDLLTSGKSSNAMSLLLSTPGVGFEAEQLIATPTGYLPYPAAPVDMNGDGALDVALILIPAPTNLGAEGEVAVYLNSGNGSLGSPSRLVIEPPAIPRDLATADFDHDGNMDVVVVASDLPPTDPKVLVYLGLGDGTLALEHSLPGGELPFSGIAADVNHDGWTDIVVADIMEDKLPVHINREGSFPDVVYIDVSASPLILKFEDFDADALPDLVVANANGIVAVVPGEN